MCFVPWKRCELGELMALNTTSTRVTAALIALACGAASALAFIPAQWLQDVDGNWTSSTAWSISPNYPDNDGEIEYDVTIDLLDANPFTVTMDQAITIRSLFMGELPTLDVQSRTMTVTGDFTLNRGVVLGDRNTGALTVGGVATLNDAWLMGVRMSTGSGSSLVFAGSDHNEICDTEIDHGGPQATWQGNGDIRLDVMQTQSRIINRSKSTFTATGDGTMSWNGVGLRSEFVNEGRFVKDGGTGTTFIDGVKFKNATGIVEVNTGTLAMNSIGDYDSASRSLNGGTWIVGNNATLAFNGVTGIQRLSGDVTLSGANSIFTAINGLQEVSAGGAFRVLEGRSFTTTGNFTNSGVVEVGSGSTFAVRNGSTFTPGTGEVRVSGDFRYDNANITTLAWQLVLGAGGRVLDQAGQDGLRNFNSIGSGGVFRVIDGRDYTFTNGLTLGSNTSLRIGSLDADQSIVTVQGTFNYGGTIELINGRLDVAGNFNQNAPLRGRGIVVATGGFTSNAIISPGASPGRLDIIGDVIFTNDSSLDFELGGIVEEVQYDVLTVAGSATFVGNAINISLLGGYDPQVGDFFDVLRISQPQLSGQYRLNGLDQGRIQLGSRFTNGVLRITVLSVPNPATSSAIAALGGLAVIRRRRR